MIKTVEPGEDIISLSLRLYGSAEGLKSLLEDNPSLNIDEEVSADMEVKVSDDKVLIPVKVQPIKRLEVRPKNKTIILHNQNAIDMAIQYYGSTEGLKALLEDNPSLFIDQAPVKGDQILIKQENVVNERMVRLFKKDSVKVATGSDILNTLEGDFWVTEADEIVEDEVGNKVVYQ